LISQALAEIKPSKFVQIENIVFFVLNMLSINLSQYYYAKPFVFIFSCFAAGVFIGTIMRLPEQFLIPAFLVLIAFLVLSVKGILKGQTFLIISGIILVGLGAIHQEFNSGLKQSDQLVSTHRLDDAYVLKVEEFSVSESGWNKCVLNAEQRIRLGNSHAVKGKLLAYIQTGEQILQPGDIILCPAEINEIRNNGNPGEFDAVKYWQTKGVSGMMFIEEENFQLLDHAEPDWLNLTVQKVRTYLSETVDELFVDDHRALVKAIVLGDKSLLDTETRETFGNTGAMHVLAVSGLHVGILMLLLMFCFERFSSLISRRTALIVVLIILWFYAFLTGLSPSVIRAVFMFSILVASQVFYKKYDPINVLFFTAFVLIVVNPNYLMDMGFQLSYLAMLGIFVFYRPIENAIQVENFILKKAWQGTAVGLAAQLMTLPLILGYFHQFPNYFMLSNLGLMLFSGLILGLGVAVFAFSFSSLIVKPVALILNFILFLTIAYLQWIEDLPGAVAKGYDVNTLQLILLFALPFVLFGFWKRKALRYASVIVTVFLAFWITMERFDRMEKSELVIYNSRAAVFTLKQGDRILCLYDDQRIEKDKVERMVNDYAKLFPGNVSYCSLNDMKINLRGRNFEMEVIAFRDHYSIRLGEQKISLIRSIFHKSNKNDGAIVVGMPWLRNGADHYLYQGAFKRTIPT
jgi:competence protein ComEC